MKNLCCDICKYKGFLKRDIMNLLFGVILFGFFVFFIIVFGFIFMRRRVVRIFMREIKEGNLFEIFIYWLELWFIV